MGAAGLEINGVEGLAGGHEETVALGTAEADVGADLGEEDLPDADAVGGEDVDAVVTRSDPAGAGIEVARDVAADAIGKAAEIAAGHGQLHGGELAAARERDAVDDI